MTEETPPDDFTLAERFALTAHDFWCIAQDAGDTETAHWATWLWGMLATPRLIDHMAARIAHPETDQL